MIEIFPAIDLMNGKAVRLVKGQKQSAKIYGEAIDFAKHFQDCGAKWIHIVDLDGAFEGNPKNIHIIENIANNTSLKIQVGGGIRTEDTIKNYLKIGINRIILGSIVIKQLDFVINMANKYPLAVSIDAKDGKIATNGWAEVSNIDSIEFVKKLQDSNLEAIICTDINQDGLLSGMNLDFIQEIAKQSKIFTIASGGFSSIQDIEKLKKYPQIGGVIIGKAFYEGKVDLKNIKF